MNENLRESMSSVSRVRTKIKVVFLGDQSTGKTSILLRFIHNKFEEGPCSTVGIDFLAKTMSFGETSLRLQLWDTAGQERFRSLIPSYLKDSAITFIVFDLTNLKSFDNLNEWIELCQNNRLEKNLVIILGNKSDLIDEREVTPEAIAKKFAKMTYFEVSAKTGAFVNEAFQHAGKSFLLSQATEENIIDPIFNDKPIISKPLQIEEFKKSNFSESKKQKNCCK